VLFYVIYTWLSISITPRMLLKIFYLNNCMQILS